jgi:DNA-binding Lrp family transcriptional regulator
VGASPTTVRPILQRLLGDGAVRVAALVDPSAVGRPVAAFLRVTAGDARGVSAALASSGAANWVAEAEDLVTVLGQVSVSSNGELRDLVDDLRSAPSVQRVTSALLLRASARGGPAGSGSRPSAVALDDVDRAIAQALQQDGRASFTELAHRTGLSVPAARQRFLRLQAAGMLTVRAVPDPGLLGLAAGATVDIVIRGRSATVVAELERLPAVVYVVEVAGGWDLSVDLACEDDEALRRTVAEILALSGVQSCAVARYRAVVKREPYF